LGEWQEHPEFRQEGRAEEVREAIDVDGVASQLQLF